MNWSPTFQPLPPGPATDMIVVVADHEVRRNHICGALLPFFRVIGVDNTESGWQIILKYVPSLVIADVTLSGIDGLRLCRHLKEDDRTGHIPIIIIASEVDIEMKIEVYNSGADEYMPNPIHIRELQARARNLVEARSKLLAQYDRLARNILSNECMQSADRKFVERAIEVVERHMDNSQFGVEKFAREVGLSSVQLYRKLRSLTGLSPNCFTRERRLQQSARLLESNFGNIAEVAYRVGFNNLPYFSKCFRRKFGCNPSSFSRRKMHFPSAFARPEHNRQASC